MSPDPTSSPAGGERIRPRSPLRSILLTVGPLAAVCALLLGYLYSAGPSPGPGPAAAAPSVPSKEIQLDVLNGCGARGAGAAFTSFLRNSGFDVVELRNYSSSAVERTMVIDRVGNLEAARRVAEALGVSGTQVIQQLNPDYFVHVSVVIGGDHALLAPGRAR